MCTNSKVDASRAIITQANERLVLIYSTILTSAHSNSLFPCTLANNSHNLGDGHLWYALCTAWKRLLLSPLSLSPSVVNGKWATWTPLSGAPNPLLLGARQLGRLPHATWAQNEAEALWNGQRQVGRSEPSSDAWNGKEEWRL